MTTLVGGIGFLMMLIGCMGACNEDMAILTAFLVVALVGVLMMYAASKLEEKKKRRYIYKRF